jgi:hypothetical protein
MYRKRKNPSPAFRLPQPFNAVTGQDHSLSPAAPFCRFELLEALTTSLDRAEAKITHQWGVGSRHSYEDTIVALNLEKGPLVVVGDEEYEDVTYLLSGSVGDAGIASWVEGQLWRILRMESDGQLVELCAQEAATRNEPYECLLGRWNADSGLWCYVDAPTVFAVDHRVGPPLAEENWKGLYQRMPSSNEEHNGSLYVCVSLDCEEPDEGCSCGGA